MKQLTLYLMIAAMLLSLTACGGANGESETTQMPTAETVGQVMDVSGKYVLNTDRNEAVVNDAGGAAVPVEGNARVYYQIFVGSFSDSNGDGIGDLRGIINRFDYLNDGKEDSGMSLGVEGIWLSPIFKSPSYHKYDVTDYYEIDPKFGTMEDLQELIQLCHSRNVQIILDLVINHTAASNEWFKSFREAHQQGNTESEYYDFYSYTNAPAPGKTFQSIAGTEEYYECNFSGSMPELNFDLPAVRQAVLDVAKFYLDLGVDGFRFDAAKYVYFGEESRNAEFWNWYMQELRAIKPDIYTVAEVWDSDEITFPYFTSTNCFNFSMAQTNGRIAETARAGDVNVFMGYVDRYLEEIQSRNPEAMLTSFIANHDTDRAAGYLTVASGQAKVAANLNLLLPGSPFIYYGEEIGLKGSRGGASTDANRRLAMFWGDEDTVSDPEGADYDSPQSNGSVAQQKADGSSLYNHYKKLIAIRKANPEIAYGTFTPLTVEGSKLGGFLAEWNGSTVAVLHNTSLSEVTLDLAVVEALTGLQVTAYAGVNDAALEGTVLTIGGQTSVVLR